MSVLVAQGIEKTFGGQIVLDQVSLRLEWGQKLALVGVNGAGKTTLLRILSGELEPDQGSVSVARGVRLGSISQEHAVRPDNTVWEEAERALSSFLALEHRMRQCEEAMASAVADDLHAIMEEYSALHDRFEAMGGHDVWRDVRRVLGSMGFGEADFGKPCAALSGGQRTRLALARMVLAGTEVLLLDEPTNHLDVEATEWLESFLATFGGALILVSHDRRFLDNVVNAVMELDRGRLSHYRGNFTSYWNQRNARLQRSEEDARRRTKEIDRLEEFWRRNKAGQNRGQAWSRYRAAQRLRKQERDGPSSPPEVSLGIEVGHRSGNEVVIAQKLTKRFGEHVLFTDLDLLVTRNQKIGVVGPNGSGKTTFLRLVLGIEPPTSGTVRLGARVVPGYFAQDSADLDPSLTVVETLLETDDIEPARARDLLARFLFTGDDVFKRVHQLSGGEKNRLVLATLALRRPNLLVLDEPTNHLDIAARHALARLLKDYDGTLLLVSHDRYLLDAVTTHTLEISNGCARLYDGSYSRYRERKTRESQRATPASSPSPSPARPMTSFELARMRRHALKAVADAELRVGESEDWLKRIEECLSHPQPGDDLVQLAHDYSLAKRDLEEAMAAWEHAMEEAERLGC